MNPYEKLGFVLVQYVEAFFYVICLSIVFSFIETKGNSDFSCCRVNIMLAFISKYCDNLICCLFLLIMNGCDFGGG